MVMQISRLEREKIRKFERAQASIREQLSLSMNSHFLSRPECASDPFEDLSLFPISLSPSVVKPILHRESENIRNVETEFERQWGQQFSVDDLGNVEPGLSVQLCYGAGGRHLWYRSSVFEDFLVGKYRYPHHRSGNDEPILLVRI